MVMNNDFTNELSVIGMGENLPQKYRLTNTLSERLSISDIFPRTR